jgi:hypothetical protein
VIFGRGGAPHGGGRGFNPSFIPPGEHTQLFRRTKGQTVRLRPSGPILPLWVNLTPVGQLHPRGLYW